MPSDLGPLPIRGRLVRTEPRGTMPSPIAIVGLYPALTRTARFESKEGPRLVPVEVEGSSFEGSRSAAELEKKFLDPLGLTPGQVFLIDLYPYYLANAGKGRNGRTMWDNIVAYHRETKKMTAVKRRPPEDDMVELCRTLDGNRERLAHYFDLCNPKLVITVGNEVAAFARDLKVAKEAQQYLYANKPTKSAEFGSRRLDVVNCAHPGILMRPRATEWNRKHDAWCAGAGAKLVAEALRA